MCENEPCILWGGAPESGEAARPDIVRGEVRSIHFHGHTDVRIYSKSWSPSRLSSSKLLEELNLREAFTEEQVKHIQHGQDPKMERGPPPTEEAVADRNQLPRWSEYLFLRIRPGHDGWVRLPQVWSESIVLTNSSVNNAVSYYTTMKFGTEGPGGAPIIYNSLLQGGIVSVYYLGTLVGALLGGWFGDKQGRIKAIAFGAVWAILGASLQSSAQNHNWMICARTINGIGTGILNAIVPVYATETAEHTSRGQFVAIEFTLNIFGKQCSISAQHQLLTDTRRRRGLLVGIWNEQVQERKNRLHMEVSDCLPAHLTCTPSRHLLGFPRIAQIPR